MDQHRAKESKMSGGQECDGNHGFIEHQDWGSYLDGDQDVAGVERGS